MWRRWPRVEVAFRDRRENEIHGQAWQADDAGHRLFADHDADIDVLDLTFDSVLDDPAGLADEKRRLRFEAGDRSVQVDVHGIRQLSVGVTVQPSGAGAVEVWTRDRESLAQLTATVGTVGAHRTPLQPGLTTFVVRWPAGGPGPARTAWVLL